MGNHIATRLFHFAQNTAERIHEKAMEGTLIDVKGLT